MLTLFRSAARLLPVAAVSLGVAALPGAAQARVFVGFGFGAPYYAPPPVYAPPAYYYPPPAYAPPPQPYEPATGYGGTCYAGPYVCRLAQAQPAGSECSCPGIGARSYGTAG